MLLSFASCGKVKIDPKKVADINTFRVTTYVVADRVQNKESLNAEDFDIVTDVILFGCVTFDEEGNVNVNAEVMNTALSNLREVIGDRAVKIHINVLGPDAQTDSTDWNKQMDDKAKHHSNAFKTDSLIPNLIKLVNENAFDGLFFDYEYPIKKKYWRDFSKFLVETDEQLGDKILGVALSHWDMGLSKDAIAVVDRVEMMLYDMYDAEGRHSTYEQSISLLDPFLQKGFKREVLDFGVPFYARPTDQSAFWPAYNDFYDKLDENGFAVVDEDGKKAYFNTPDVIAQKTKFAIDNGCGGMMIWHYSCDVPSTEEASCLKAMGDMINSYK